MCLACTDAWLSYAVTERGALFLFFYNYLVVFKQERRQRKRLDEQRDPIQEWDKLSRPTHSANFVVRTGKLNGNQQTRDGKQNLKECVEGSVTSRDPGLACV